MDTRYLWTGLIDHRELIVVRQLELALRPRIERDHCLHVTVRQMTRGGPEAVPLVVSSLDTCKADNKS